VTTRRPGWWCGCATSGSQAGVLLVGLVVTEPAHFVMERKMIKTIKQLVERPRRDAISV
jgi:hypothetical protein